MEITTHITRQIDGGKCVHFHIGIHDGSGGNDISGAILGGLLDSVVAGLPGIVPGNPFGLGGQAYQMPQDLMKATTPGRG